VPATVSVSLTSNVIALMSRAALRVGPASLSGKNNPTDFLFHIAVPLDWQNDPHRHQTLRNLDIIERLDIPHHSLGHQVEITEEERLQAGRLLAAFVNEHNILVGFHPGAGKVPNRWPAERFAQLANLLVERCFIGAVITAGPMDDEPVHLMLRHINCPHLVMRHKPIRDVAAILSRLNLFVTNDTGIMHVAAGMGTPTLSLFGSTDPKQWAPLGEKNRYIQSESGDIQDITVKEVFLAAVEMLTH
jgi:ADP-heptose:LPS heptosyltransferase